jgi:hypothetical protein
MLYCEVGPWGISNWDVGVVVLVFVYARVWGRGARTPVRRLSGRTLELETAFLSDTEVYGQQSTLCNM